LSFDDFFVFEKALKNPPQTKRFNHIKIKNHQIKNDIIFGKNITINQNIIRKMGKSFIN
jgi:hypothetical protein